jgi:hypothetical protein
MRKKRRKKENEKEEGKEDYHIQRISKQTLHI